MAARHVSLRVWLLLSFVGIVAIPLLVAGWFGIKAYSDALDTEAGRAVERSMSVARATLDARVAERQQDAVSLSRNATLSSATDPVELTSELQARVNMTGATAALLVDTEGRVVAASGGMGGRTLAWPLVAARASQRATESFMAIVPQAELDALGLAESEALPAKETEGGTVVPGEDQGSLAIVATAPITSSAGASDRTIVLVDSLKRRDNLVDEIVGIVGGASTIFQNGVRITTTVKTEDGARAIGTVISDPVRQRTLVAGAAYRGQAFVVNQDMATAYDPLTDPDGTTIGMIFVGIPLKPYQESTTAFAVSFTAILAIALLVAAGIAFIVSRSVTRPLLRVDEIAAKVAEGDLTITVPDAGYEEATNLGESFNAMTASLRRLIEQVAMSASGLQGVAAQITEAAADASNMASRQASSVSQATSTLAELSATFSAVADGAGRVLDAAEDSLESAESGRETIDSGDRTMEDLAGGAEEVRAAAEVAASVAHDISEMTVIISQFAEQTKILAFNAAIEAARAGEAGRGFSVVSTEIRTLADSVSKSAGRIAEMVSGVQQASAQLLATAERQTELTHTGVDQTRGTREAFDRIVETMAQTTAAAREIATAAKQQKTAAEQMVQAMQEVNALSAENAAASRQLAETARLVQSEADTLRRGMEGFKTR